MKILNDLLVSFHSLWYRYTPCLARDRLFVLAQTVHIYIFKINTAKGFLHLTKHSQRQQHAFMENLFQFG